MLRVQRVFPGECGLAYRALFPPFKCVARGHSLFVHPQLRGFAVLVRGTVQPEHPPRGDSAWGTVVLEYM